MLARCLTESRVKRSVFRRALPRHTRAGSSLSCGFPMARSMYVEFRGHGFWAFDVVSGVFLKHLVDVAALRVTAQREPWLSEAVDRWRFNAVVCDCGLFLDEKWSAEQVRSVIDLATAACNVLLKRDDISAGEMSSWQLLYGEGVFPRGLESVTTASAVRLGRAII